MQTIRRYGGLAAGDHGQDDARAPLLLLHGLTFDRSTWSPALAALRDVDPDRRAVAVDLPGHGGSPEQPRYDLDRVADQIDAVVAEAGLTAPVVVGHSAGAILATVYAARYPTRGVVNVDQGLAVGPFAGLVRSLADGLRGPAFPAIWRRFFDSFQVDLLPPAAQALVRSTCRPRQQVVLGFWRQLLDEPVEDMTALVDATTVVVRAAGVPYRYVAGHEPPPADRQWLADRLPEAAVEVWPDSGHFPHLAHPDRFAHLLAATAGWPPPKGQES